MEGIRDGRAVDSCFYCALLYPALDSCERCGKRLRYEPALMMPADRVEMHLQNLVKHFQEAATPATAEALLRFLHDYGEEIHLELIALPSIEILRQVYNP